MVTLKKFYSLSFSVCLFTFCSSSTAVADSLVEIIESEFETSIVAVCWEFVRPEEELPFLAFDERGTPVGKCPNITVEGEACVENTYGNNTQRWWRATVAAAKANAKEKYEAAHGSSACSKENGKCKLCTRSSGLKNGKCKFSPSQTAGSDDEDDPQAGTISGSEETWLKDGDDNTMCAKVTFGCPYECKS